MKTLKILQRGLCGALLLGFGGSAGAQIVTSQHDLTVGGGGQGNTANTTEVCVFCHTPHGAVTGAPVPLWNKVLPSTSYTRYSSLNLVSFDSIEAPVGSVSLACLSCHDGTQAMDVVVNSPGSGGYNPAGSEIDPVAIGVMTGIPVPTLGSDLTDDHPISMQYGGGGATDADADGTFAGILGDPDFTPPEKATINSSPIWWIDSPGDGGSGGNANVREKQDMLLYSRDDLGAVQPFVECASCHDPHNSSTAGPTSVAFLRIPNTDSQICTSCHLK